MSKIDNEVVQEIIREVAETEILPRFRNLKEGDIEYKGPDDPVTIADKAAEKALSDRLTGLLPGSKVVGEEEFASNGGVLDVFSCESPVWIIDPIDGTRAFMQGKPLFGVIVALAEQNHTIAGWLYDPASKEFVTVERGAGAWHKGKRLSVARPAPLGEMRGALGYHILKIYKNNKTSAGPVKPKFDMMSYACHEYARMIVDEPHFACPEGKIHFRASLAYCTPWDDAAGILAIEESGGYAAHWNGERFRPSHYGRGLMAAPDRESWMEIKNWISGFCELEG